LAVVGLGRADAQVAAATIAVMTPDNCMLSIIDAIAGYGWEERYG
jgi:hypothetical protein